MSDCLMSDCLMGDHHWFGGSCSICGKRLRCGCGQFWDGSAEHFFRCPVVLKMERQERAARERMWG